MTSQERNKFRARRSKCTQSLKHSFKKVSVSHAQLAHSSTLAKEKHMLLILNFSTLTFITNARTTMPFARLHSQMVCTQSEPAEIPQHMFVQILVQAWCPNLKSMRKLGIIISWCVRPSSWWRLWTRKGLQGGNTIQQRSEIYIAVIHNTSITGFCLHSFALSCVYLWQCYSFLVCCCTAVLPGAGTVS